MVHGVGVLLLASIGGYWVLERSETHKGELKRAGRLLGLIIIMVSLAGVVYLTWRIVVGDRACPFGMSGKRAAYHHYDHPPVDSASGAVSKDGGSRR